MKLSNSYTSLGKTFYQKSRPTSFEQPQLKLWNTELADELNIPKILQDDPKALAAYFSGQQLLEGSQPVALAYAGHQFGHFVPQLGDGRAHLLGDVVDRFGKSYEIQLKGSGATQFSRRGDGRCALGPAVREYIMSEAMFALGVPTTRCLAVVTTGESVARNHVSPGAVVTRVASSHIRVGTFQYFAARDDVESLQKLCNYTIQRHYPTLWDVDGNKAVMLLEAVMQKQIELIVEWMRVGFIHGVMNTDNTHLAGDTIDFGPCAMMGVYNPATVFSSIDKMGRYAFGNQADIAQWNMARLGECLLPLVDKNQDKAVNILLPMVESFSEQFDQAYDEMMAKKFGFILSEQHESDFIQTFMTLMQEQRLDYTRTFDALTKAVLGDKDTQLQESLGDLFTQWKLKVTQQNIALTEVEAVMRGVNPVVIPRNHHVEAVLQACEAGDFSGVQPFLAVLRSPYETIPETLTYQDAARDNDAYYQTFCGT